MSGHGDSSTALKSVFALPEDGGGLGRKGPCQLLPERSAGQRTHLILSIEVDATPPIERNIAKCARLVPTPRKHRQRHGNRNINSDLSHVDLPLVLPSSSPRLGEDCGSVTILVLVDNLESFVESLGIEDNKDGSENLFVVALHCCVGFDDGRSDEVPVWIALHCEVTPIQNDLSAFRLGGTYQPDNTFLGGWRDDGAPARI